MVSLKTCKYNYLGVPDVSLLLDLLLPRLAVSDLAHLDPPQHLVQRQRSLQEMDDLLLHPSCYGNLFMVLRNKHIWPD